MTVPSKGKEKFRGTPTTRMYPRTLAEAFPNSKERAEWFFPPEKNHTASNVSTALVGIALWVCLAYIFAKN